MTEVHVHWLQCKYLAPQICLKPWEFLDAMTWWEKLENTVDKGCMITQTTAVIGIHFFQFRNQEIQHSENFYSSAVVSYFSNQEISNVLEAIASPSHIPAPIDSSPGQHHCQNWVWFLLGRRLHPFLLNPSSHHLPCHLLHHALLVVLPLLALVLWQLLLNQKSKTDEQSK